METEKVNGSKDDRGATEVRNGQSERSKTESRVSRHDEIHSESLSRSSSSSSSSSSSTPLKGLQEMDSSQDPNSRSENPAMSQKDSPPVQKMDRNVPEGYDPSRIPASVFERNKSNIPAEWSCTSNESLFSIHLGNNSFSVYGDLMKSGELFKSGEFVSYSPAFPLTPPTKIEPNEKTVNPVKEEVEIPKEVEKESDEKSVDPPAVSWRSPTTSYRSNRSSNSTHSFSFPILEGVTNESGDAEAEDVKKQKVNAAMETTSNHARSRWLCCFPPCPWFCSSCVSCSCC